MPRKNLKTLKKSPNKKRRNKSKKFKLSSYSSGIPVFFVRHGESTNNVIQEPLIEKKMNNEITDEEFERIWKSNRMDDPDLTLKGKEQAIALGKYLKKGLNISNRKIHIYSSPFKRTLDTTDGIAKSFNKNEYKVTVRPDIFENGGVYSVNKNSELTEGECFSGSEIKNKYNYNVDLLPSAGPWYTGNREDDARSKMRAERVAKWIKSKEFRKENENKIVLMVMHGNFIDYLLKEIMNINAKLNFKTMSEYEVHSIYFDTPNTATSLFVVRNGKIIIKNICNVEHLNLPAEYSIINNI